MHRRIYWCGGSRYSYRSHVLVVKQVGEHEYRATVDGLGDTPSCDSWSGAQRATIDMIDREMDCTKEVVA